MRFLAALTGAAFAYLLTARLLGRSAGSLRRRRQRAGARGWLRQAGVTVTPTKFAATSGGLGLAAAGVVWAASGALPLAVAIGIGVATLPKAWFARQRELRARERLVHWPEVLRDLVAHLETPMSLHRALVELSMSGPRPFRPIWSRYRQLAATLDQRTALLAVKADLADPVSDRTIEIIISAGEQGTVAAIEILRRLADDTTKDLRLLEAMETAQLEQRIEANAAVVLPFAVLVFLCATAAPFREFYSSAAGGRIIAIGAVMSLAGRAVIRRLGALPEEERVMTGTIR